MMKLSYQQKSLSRCARHRKMIQADLGDFHNTGIQQSSSSHHPDGRMFHLPKTDWDLALPHRSWRRFFWNILCFADRQKMYAEVLPIRTAKENGGKKKKLLQEVMVCLTGQTLYANYFVDKICIFLSPCWGSH